MAIFLIRTNCLASLPHFRQGSASVFSLQTKLAFLCKKLRSSWRKLKNNAIYRLASELLPQDRLLLFSSSPEDRYGNINALAKKMRVMQMPFIWLKQEQIRSHPFRTLVSLARARVLVIDASSPAAHVELHQNTCLIHCWHAGGAYKKIAFDAKRKNYNDTNEEKRIRRIHRNISWFVCTSEETARTYAKAFRLPQERMLVFGSPRLDDGLQGEFYPVPSTYTILYAPTFRTHGKNVRYLPPLPDAGTLSAALASRLDEDVRLAFRRHPSVPVSGALMGWEDWSNIPQHEALRQASILITDYSSIFFDFIPLKRPIIFYVPDFNNYQCNERELYFSPYDAFPDTTCADEETLIHLLEHCRHMRVDYDKIWQKHMSACDGKASERICAFIQNIMRETI